MRKFVKYNLAIIILIILAVVFLPTVISKDAESESDAIVTAIGVDKQQNNYQLSMQIVVPTPASQYNQKLSVVSDVGQDISSAISKIQLRLGKQISLSHCKVFVFSTDVARDGLTRVFDYVFRTKNNTQNVVLIHTPDDAKEFLQNTSDLENNLYFSIRNRGSFNENYIIGDQTTLGEYYSDYLGPVKICTVATVELVSEQSGSNTGTSGGGEDSANESASGSQSSSQPNEQKKVVVNRGKIMVLKNGEYLIELTPEQSQCINWYESKSKEGIIVLENVTQKGLFDNGNVGVELDEKETTIKASFDGEVPVFELDLKLYIRTVEINQKNYTGNSYKSNSVNVTNYLKHLVEQKVTEQAKEAFDICKDNNADILGVYKTFYKYKNKEFRKYLNSLTDKDNYLQGINLKVNVKVQEYL